MSHLVKIGNFEYFTDLLEAAKTSKYYDRMRVKILIASEIEKNPQKRYGAWMAGRRAGEYQTFAEYQLRQIHNISLIFEDTPVCDCGLVAKVEPEKLLEAPGHIEHPSRKLVNAFYVNEFSEETQKLELMFFCQTCLEKRPAYPTDDLAIDVALLNDFVELHTHLLTESEEL